MTAPQRHGDRRFWISSTSGRAAVGLRHRAELGGLDLVVAQVQRAGLPTRPPARELRTWT